MQQMMSKKEMDTRTAQQKLPYVHIQCVNIKSDCLIPQCQYLNIEKDMQFQFACDQHDCLSARCSVIQGPPFRDLVNSINNSSVPLPSRWRILGVQYLFPIPISSYKKMPNSTFQQIKHRRTKIF